METTEEKTGTIPDFTSLPDVVWFEVLKLLTVEERYVLSQTCKRLYTLFSSPSVWKSIFLKTNSYGNYDELGFESMDVGYLPQCQLSALRTFGGFMECVTLQTSVFDISRESYSALQSLQNGNDLQSFTVILDCCDTILDTDLFYKLDNYNTPNICKVISAVHSQWPECALHIDYSYFCDTVDLYINVFQCSPSDFRCKHLRTLVINDIYTEAGCTEEDLRNKLDPPRQNPTPDMVTRFPALQHLSLSQFNVSDHLLETLAQQQSSLCTLTVNFLSSKMNKADQVNDVSSTAWSRLVAACPLLQVFCSFSDFHDAERVVKPEAPLVGVDVWRVCREATDFGSFKSFCLDHRNTLLKLSYNMPESTTCQVVPDSRQPEELPIVSIATGCPKLVEIIYGGVIERNDVIRLAEVDRKWKTLKIYDFVKSRNEQSESHRDFRELEASVSQHLGYPWKVSTYPAHDDVE